MATSAVKLRSLKRAFITPVLFLAQGVRRIFELAPPEKGRPPDDDGSDPEERRPSRQGPSEVTLEALAALDKDALPIIGPGLLEIAASRSDPGAAPPGLRRLVLQLVQACADYPPGEVSARTYYLGPLKNARAEEVARVLRDLYRDSKPQAVTVAVDSRSNSLILRGPAPLYEEARKVVDRLDAAAGARKKE